MFGRGIWELARLLVGATGLYGLVFMIFSAVGLVLVLFAVNLDAVDHWLDQRAGWFDWAGTILFKAFLAMILAGCVFVVGQRIAYCLPLPGRPPRHKEHRSARAGGDHPTARADGAQRMLYAKSAARLAENGAHLPGTDGAGERMTGYHLESEYGEKRRGWGAVSAAIVIGYFAYVGLVK